MSLLRSALGLATSVTLATTMSCGGSSSNLIGQGQDSGGSESGATGDSGSSGDSSGGDSGAKDSASADSPNAGDTGMDAAVCRPLGAGDTDVYVDQSFTGSPRTGAAACPLQTIDAGIVMAATLTGKITIHVAGSAAGITYNEASVVAVGSNMILQGDGPAKTTISASGACDEGSLGSKTCAVTVAGGGVVNGFTVASATGDGIVTAGANQSPVVKNTAVKQCMGNGIVALGGVELGPNIVASNNVGAGVESPANAVGVVHVANGMNAFDTNMWNGLNFDGGATLNFEGGTASGDFQGIRLAGAASGGHTITGLTAKNNKGPGGVVAYGGQTIKMRSSTLLANTGAGLLYDFVNGSTLDLGTGADPGGNTFGGATAANLDAVGIELCAAPATLNAQGNRWSVCPATQAVIVCGNAIASYADVAYHPAAAASVIDTSGCTVGP